MTLSQCNISPNRVCPLWILPCGLTINVPRAIKHSFLGWDIRIQCTYADCARKGPPMRIATAIPTMAHRRHHVDAWDCAVIGEAACNHPFKRSCRCRFHDGQHLTSQQNCSNLTSAGRLLRCTAYSRNAIKNLTGQGVPFILTPFPMSRYSNLSRVLCPLTISAKLLAPFDGARLVKRGTHFRGQKQHILAQTLHKRAAGCLLAG